ncbi:hypothetical protein JCM8115_001920 [Rhodotorula mucilaginosa]
MPRSEDDDRDDDRSSHRDGQGDRHTSSRGKDRERSRDRDRERSSRHSSKRDDHRSSRRSPAAASSSGSDSDDSRDHRRHRRRRHDSRDRDDKDERRRRREEKKARKAKREKKKRAKAGLAPVEWGKHGILTEADIYTKSDEFHAWMIGERMMNPETTTKAKEKELFKQFMEDFNTGTLPHEKYYDLKKHEMRMSAIKMGETVDTSDTYDFNRDLESARATHRRSASTIDDQLLDRKRLEDLRRVQNERVQREKMTQLGLKVSEKLGVRLEDKMR